MRPIATKRYTQTIGLWFLAAGLLGFFLSGCATSSRHSANETMKSGAFSSGIARTNSGIAKQPIIKKPLLPLGIGGSFNLYASDAADDLSAFYNNVIRPVRSGKIFKRQPYEMDYGILPSGSEGTSTRNDQNKITIKSNYQFKIGMSRKFHNFGDFLKADFWLARGAYSPSYVSPVIVDQVDPFALSVCEEEDFSLDQLTPSSIDIGQIIEDRWNLFDQ
ncbi:MAG: hypothetical protein AB1656_17870 [Candidatus Omnitrophota bacterium]